MWGAVSPADAPAWFGSTVPRQEARASLNQSQGRRAAPLVRAPAAHRRLGRRAPLRGAERVERWRRAVSVREPRSPGKDAQSRAAGLPQLRSILRNTLIHPPPPPLTPKNLGVLVGSEPGTGVWTCGRAGLCCCCPCFLRPGSSSRRRSRADCPPRESWTSDMCPREFMRPWPTTNRDPLGFCSSWCTPSCTRCSPTRSRTVSPARVRVCGAPWLHTPPQKNI